MTTNLDNLGFRFKVGDIVHHRLTSPREYPKDLPPQVRTPLLIIARTANECSGGIQLHYECRIGIASGSPPMTFDPSRMYMFHELEVG